MKLKKAVTMFLESKKGLSSYPTYRSCSKYIKDYDLSEIDLAGDLKVSERKNIIRKTRRLFENIENKLQGKSQNTKFFTITMAKSILKMVENNDGSRFWMGYSVSQEKKDIVILDMDFAKAFVNDDHDLYKDFGHIKKTVWEMSVIMLTTSLRFSDAKNLTIKNLDGGRITIKNQKTGTITSCPIPESLYKRLVKNESEFGRLYTMEISKDIAYRFLPKMLGHYPEMEDLKDQVKFHIFRKTAISLMLAMGVPQSIVMRASGHSVGSKAFARYVGHVETVFNKEINDFQSKFYES